jgi:outer membrane protein assembly factor BamB
MVAITHKQMIPARRLVALLLLAAMLLLAFARPATPVLAADFTERTDWAQEGFDLQRSGHNPFENALGVGNASSLRLAWSTSIPVDPDAGAMIVHGSPISFGGRVYAGGADGLYGLDPSTGAIIINYRTGGPILGAPAAAKGLKVLGQQAEALFVGSIDGSIYGFDTTDERPNPLWKASVGPGIQTSLLLIGGQIPPGPCLAPGPCKIIFGAADGLYAYDSDGNRLWAAALDGLIAGAPSASSDAKCPWIFVGTQSNLLYAVNSADGRLVWATKLDGVPGTAAIGNSTITGDDGIFVGTSAGTLYSLNPADGSLRWQFATGGAIVGGLALGDVNGDGVAEVVVGSQGGEIYAIDQTDDKPLPLWVARLGARITAAPALANGVLYLVAEGGDISRGSLFALNAATGAVLSQVGLPSAVHAAPIVADGKVFMAADDGTISMTAPPEPR